MRHLYTTLLCLLIIINTTHAQKTKIDNKLQQKIEKLISGFEGVVGIYVKNLKTDQTVSIHADTLFPTASTIKVPIMAGIFDKIDRGELKYNQDLQIDTSKKLYIGDQGIIASMRDSSHVVLNILQMLSISISDNSASLWLQELAGTGTAINEVMAKYGFVHTRVNSRTPGRAQAMAAYGWGQTTPREMATLLEKIRKGEMISAAASQEMYRVLGNMYFDNRSLSSIPPYIKTASKTGSINGARSETVLVNAPHGDYVFAICTKNIKDQSWGQDNASFMLIKNLSSLLWNYFEPGYGWQPLRDQKYQKQW